MKTLLLSSLLSLGLTAAGRADWTIEQKMTTNADKPTIMTIMVKDSKARMDQGKQLSVLMDGATQEMITLMHEEKMIMRVNSKGLQGLMGLAGQLLDKNNSKPQATGQKETIAGHECEIYDWKGGKIKGRFWVAKDFPNAKAIASMLEKLASNMANPIMSMGPKPSDFPGLMICSEIETLGQKVRTEWVSVKEAPLDDKLFVAPEGYEEFKMPQLPNFKIPGQ